MVSEKPGLATLSIVSSNRLSKLVILLIVPEKPLWGGDNEVCNVKND